MVYKVCMEPVWAREDFALLDVSVYTSKGASYTSFLPYPTLSHPHSYQTWH